MMFSRTGRDIVFGAGKRRKFSSRNRDVDLTSKLASLKVSASVVSLESYSGDAELFQCSGTVIETGDKSAIVLTSAYLLRCSSRANSIAPNIKLVVHLPNLESCEGEIIACDFHYNLAALEIGTSNGLVAAPVAFLNDSLAINTALLPSLLDRKTLGLRPHSTTVDIIPGDQVTCVGHFFEHPFDIMAAPGIFSDERHDAVCRELFVATCNITRCGIGGPLVNSSGCVIGLCFYELDWTPFLPMNLVLAWWEQHKKYGELRRPVLGMELRNLSSTWLGFMEMITRKFPNILQGVFVNWVTPGSSAEAAGLKDKDVIIRYGERDVRSVLEVIEESWKKVGEAVELVIIRESNDLPVHMSMSIDVLADDNFYIWNTWENVP